MQQDVSTLTKDMIRSEINALNMIDPWTPEDMEYRGMLDRELDKRSEDDFV